MYVSMTAAPLSMLQQRCRDTGCRCIGVITLDRAGMRRHDLGTMVVSKRWAEVLLGRTGKKSQHELVEHCELSPYDAPLFDQALRSLAFGMDVLREDAGEWDPDDDGDAWSAGLDGGSLRSAC